MADKYFIATCEKKSSIHPVKDGKKFIVPVKADTQANAKVLAEDMVKKLDPAFESEDAEYSKWFKKPQLDKVSEEEFNEAELALNAEHGDIEEYQEQQSEISDYPQVEDDGFFNSNHPQAETSSFIYRNDGEVMQAAKVFILNVSPTHWAFGFKYRSGEFEKHEKMNLDRIEKSREDAIDSGISRLERFFDYQDEFSNDESQTSFLAAVMNHDFYSGFETPVDKFINAIQKHRNFSAAVIEHPDFIDVLKTHFSEYWTEDCDQIQLTEHLNTMVNIDVLYDQNVFKEILNSYLPSGFSEKTKQSMERIKDALDKPAANDELAVPKCWKAALPIRDELYVVIAIKDCDDEGWSHAFEGNLKEERIFGDSNSFSDEFAINRKEAIKMAAQHITDALYQYDTSLSLAKIFMKSPYIQDFEENCTEIGFESESSDIDDTAKIKKAIQKRFDARPTETKPAEIDLAYDAIMELVTEHTDIDALVESIAKTEHCNAMFMSPGVNILVASCTHEPPKLNTLVYEAVQKRLNKASVNDNAEIMQAHDNIASNVTDSTDIGLLCEAIKDLKNHSNLLVGTNACQLVMQCEKKQTVQERLKEKFEGVPWKGDDEYQVFISNCLVTNDAHLDYSSEHYEKMSKNLARVIREFSSDESFDKKATLNNIENNEWASGEECALNFMNVRLLRALFRENAETVTTDEIEIKSTHNKETGEDIMKIGGNNFPYNSYEFHLDHLLRINQAASVMGVGVFRRYAKALQEAYEHVDEKFKTGSEMASSVIKCFSVLGGNPEDKGIILDFLSDQERLNNRFVLIKKTKACLDPVAHLKAQLKQISEQEKEQVVNNEQKQGKSLPEQVKNLPNQANGDQKLTKNDQSKPDFELNSAELVATVTDDNSSSDVPQKIVEKEPANEPINVVTIADLPDGYQNNPNLALFMKGFKTDLQHVKPDQNGRLSIKTQYRIMKATEIWGPIGVGWGYNVLREWIDTGAPIVMNGEITQFFEQIHKLEIEFWYLHEGEKVSFTQYGDTRKLYLARGGYFVHDDEVEKKSLSDALGKAMSMTGICADVYLGTYDGDNLINKTEQFNLANRQLKQLEFDGQAADAAIAKAKTYTDKFSTAPSLAEIKRLEKLATTALEAYPTPDDDSKRKKQKAIGAIAIQAQNAIDDFTKDLKQQEQANG